MIGTFKVATFSDLIEVSLVIPVSNLRLFMYGYQSFVESAL